MLNWNEIERKVCGQREIDLTDLFSTDAIEISDAQFGWLKEILSEFDQEDKKKFIQFTWGTSRFPSNGKEILDICDGGSSENDTKLPLGENYLFKLTMPTYSSKEVMKDKLIYAINDYIFVDEDLEA